MSEIREIIDNNFSATVAGGKYEYNILFSGFERWVVWKTGDSMRGTVLYKGPKRGAVNLARELLEEQMTRDHAEEVAKTFAGVEA